MVWDPAVQRVVLFGGILKGIYNNVPLSDTWYFDGQNWTPVNSKTTIPSNYPYQATMLYDTSDRAVLFLGSDLRNATWEFINGSWSQVHPTGTIPKVNTTYGFVDDAADGYVLLVNPQTCGRTVCDADWGFHAGAWRHLNISGQNPKASQRGALAYDPAISAVVMFGGYSGPGTTPTNATWKYSNGTWVHLHPSAVPSGTSGYLVGYVSALRGVVFTDSSQSWLFANGTWTGLGATSQVTSYPIAGFFDDPPAQNFGYLAVRGLFTFGNGSWKFLADHQNQPYATYESPSINNNELLVYDGQIKAPVTVEIHHRSDFTRVWEFTNGSWKPVGSLHYGMISGFGSIAYDPTTSCVVTFGGGLQQDTHWYKHTLSNATWTWCNGKWAQQHWWNCSNVPQPQPMEEMGMHYDSADGYIVLFGGRGYISPTSYTIADLNQTWEWKGRCWSLIPTSSAPSPRDSFAMAYDSTAGCLLLFGGGSNTDTWCYHNRNWTLLAGTGPTARVMTSMADDPRHGDVILFGGSTGGTLLGDLWRFTNGTWSQVAQGPGLWPEYRYGQSMVYDPQVHGVLMQWGTTIAATVHSGTLTYTYTAGALGPWFWQ